jgi:mRNA-degrading endonuclease RelE of RelBE toxin-antitoxin system
MYRIGFTPAAAKEFAALPKEAKNKITDILDGGFAQDPYSDFLSVKKLYKPLLGYRLRIGDYRLLYLITGDYVQVYSIRHRKDAYR